MRSNRSMPRAHVIPELTYPDVSTTAEWLVEAFGCTVRLSNVESRRRSVV